MNKEKIKKTRMSRTKVKKILINVRISRDLSNWLKKEKYSPSGIFNEAVKDLGYKENDTDKQ